MPDVATGSQDGEDVQGPGTDPTVRGGAAGAGGASVAKAGLEGVWQ